MISWLVPTRGRPELLHRYLSSMQHTARAPETIEVVLRIDNDDASMNSFDPSLYPMHIQILKGDRASMGDLNRECLAAARGDLLIFGNDDLIIRSSDWDLHLERAASVYPDGIFMVHVRDGFVDHRNVCFPIFSRTLATLVPNLIPREYQGDHIDTHFEDLFDRLRDLGHPRTIYLHHVYFEHMTHANGKATLDTTYRARNHFRDYLPFLLHWRSRSDAAHQLAQIIEAGQAPQPPLRTISPSHIRALAQLSTQLIFDSRQTWKYRFSFIKHHLYRYLKLAIKQQIFF